MCDVDLSGIALDGRAVLVQNRQLVPHALDVAEEVARVGVPSHEPQRALLTGAAYEDRDALLQGPRIADGLVDGRRRPSKRGEPGPHIKRQESQGVLEAVERSLSGGNSQPYRRCSRSNQAAPRPHIARPPETTSRVATTFARCAMLR